MSFHLGDSVYTVAVKRSFVGQHFLFGGDWGSENHLHPHEYRVEVRLEGRELDEHGYLVDIVEIEALLDSLVGKYSGQTLNSLPEFIGLNPSIEHFSRIFCEDFCENLTAGNISAVVTIIWENDIAWASFRRERS